MAFEAAKDTDIREVQGVPIAIASLHLLWCMERKTYREKDLADLIFLRQQCPEVTNDP